MESGKILPPNYYHNVDTVYKCADCSLNNIQPSMRSWQNLHSMSRQVWHFHQNKRPFTTN